MKHLRKISELYKSTYLNAADRLSTFGHKSRAEELRKWADRRGISSKNVERIDSHRYFFNSNDRIKNLLVFSGYTGSEERERLGPFAPKYPYFSIVDFKFDNCFYQTWYNTGNGFIIQIQVYFQSNYDDVVRLSCNFDFRILNGEILYDFRSWIYPGEKYGEAKNIFFKFDNRRDAVKFRNFILGDVIPQMNKDRIRIQESNLVELIDDNEDIFRESVEWDGDFPLVPFDLIKKIPIHNYYEAS